MTYFPQIKTTAAELKAFEQLNFNDSDSEVIPILQLTKPRLSKTLDPLQSLNNHMERVFKRIGKNKTAIVDITQDETYQDANLNQFIHDSSDGYIHWINYLNKLKNKYNKNIIPSIVGKAAPATLQELKAQINSIYRNFDKASIRLPAKLDGDFSKLKELFDLLELTNRTHKLYVLFDFNFVAAKYLENFKGALNSLDQELRRLGWQSENVILFSSCPASFPIGNRDAGVLEELKMIEYEILEHVSELARISYGDYAYIHPERNEGGGFWLPRVDYPAANHTCYYMREFNKDMSRDPYTDKLTITTTLPNDKAYKNISSRIISEDFFTQDALTCWGRDQLRENTTADEITGKSPQHYIAIRSNMHMQRVLALLS